MRRLLLKPFLFVGLLVLAFLAVDYAVPLPDPRRMQSVIVLAEDNTPLRAFADKAGVWRYPVHLDEVSPLYLEALLSYEDRWFYYHPGINPLALIRAAGQWLQHGRIISGGSTLTMQVARIIDPHSRSLAGKLQQMWRALQLEWYYSKAEILTFYLNLAPFGGPIEGVQTASYAYLHKPVAALSHAEAALLAVLPQAPSRLRPDRHPKQAKAYRDKVLQRMARLGVWTPQRVEEARLEQVFKARFQQPMAAPLFARRMKEATTYAGQPRIRTTIDADLQWVVENSVRSRLGLLPDYASTAIVVMENATGEVKAYVGSADFYADARSGHVDMVQGLRSPGSALKPLLYGMALEAGIIHSASLLSDVPLQLGGYAPKNFLRDYQGPVTAAEALQLSLNVPAVDLLQRITPAVFDNRLQHGGIELRYPQHGQANLSLILGGAGTNLEGLVRGFSALARGGLSIRPRYTTAEPVVERRLLSAEASWVIAQLLRDVEAPPGFSTRQLGVSWKTGTSYGFRDAWALGVNSRYTVGVWTGRPDGTPLPGHFGARAAGPLLFNVFQALPAARQALPRPDNVNQQAICWPLGLAQEETSTQECQQQHLAWVIAGQIPPTLNSLQYPTGSAGVKHFWVNPRTGLRVVSRCGVAERVPQRSVVWPAALRPWLSVEILQAMQLPAYDASCPRGVRAGEHHALHVSSFSQGSVLRLPLSATPAAASLAMVAAHSMSHKMSPSMAHPELKVSLQASGGEGAYLWLVNGEPVGRDANRTGLAYAFKRVGHYELTVLDAAANVAKVNVRVIK